MEILEAKSDTPAPYANYGMASYFKRALTLVVSLIVFFSSLISTMFVIPTIIPTKYKKGFVNYRRKNFHKSC